MRKFTRKINKMIETLRWIKICKKIHDKLLKNIGFKRSYKLEKN